MKITLSKTYSKPILRIFGILLILVHTTAFAAELSKSCKDEIVSLSKGAGFDMQKFISDLPTAVVKVKAQMKMPFGKPKDGDKTSIGMSVGCLKDFPETPGDIQSAIKDVSAEIAKNAVASQVANQVPSQLTNQLDANGQGMQEMLPPLETQPQAQPQYAQPAPQYTAPAPIQYAQQSQPQYTPPAPPQYAPQPQPQPQYAYPPPSPAQPQYASQQAPAQCAEAENFTKGERWGTWALNSLIPGLGSAVIMHDWVGMGIQLGLAAFGVLSVTTLGWSEDSYCDYYNSYGGCQNYYKEERQNAFYEFGIGLLAVNFIFNIARSNAYNEPINNGIASGGYSGFNLAVLPSPRGEFMPYLTYNKMF